MISATQSSQNGDFDDEAAALNELLFFENSVSASPRFHPSHATLSRLSIIFLSSLEVNKFDKFSNNECTIRKRRVVIAQYVEGIRAWPTTF
jgi:hypothetical protein